MNLKLRLLNVGLLTSITEVRNFYVLAFFNHRFIKDFGSIAALLTECIKKGRFEWTKAAQRAFETIKGRLCSTLILALPNIDLLFKIDYDTSGIGIGEVLTQARLPLPFFSEKLNCLRLNYSTYDTECHY